MKTIILQTLRSVNANLRNPMNHAPLPYRSVLIPLLIACFALSPVAQAVVPPPDGGYPGGNTAEGQNALLSLDTSAGIYNTGVGIFSLLSLVDGDFNTGVGAGTLLLNTADRNTAVGAGALLNNAASNGNTAVGAFALFNNTGAANTAIGSSAMAGNTTGGFNVAIGEGAGFGLTSGSNNTIVGEIAGGLITTANNVICIGAGGGNVSNSCFIGHIQNEAVGAAQNPHFVLVDDTGKLGTTAVDANGNKMEGLQPQAMLRKIEELQATVAQQRKGMEVLTARLKSRLRKSKK